MPRQFFFGGNWKSNGSLESATALAEGLRAAVVNERSQVVVSPIALHLETVKRILEGSSIMVAAQNASRTGEGAFTGEISAEALRDFGIKWVILGHSERRQYYGDDDQIVADKIAKCLSENLNVIACIGETLEERKAEKTMEVVSRQLEAIRLKVNSWENIVIAYEPVWAIGTGLTASPEQAQATHAAIRQWLSEKVSPTVAASVRIIYGGSVKPANCVELIGQADIDGFLVGGASLKADLFLPIVNSPQSAL